MLNRDHQKQRRIIAAARAAGIDERSPAELPPHELFDRVRTVVPDVTIDELIDALGASAAALQEEANELKQFANAKWPDKYDYALTDEDEYERAHDHEERLTEETAEFWQQVMHDQAGPIPVHYGLIEMGVDVELDSAACNGRNLAQVTGKEVLRKPSAPITIYVSTSSTPAAPASSRWM
jgi:hypothetical protein